MTPLFAYEQLAWHVARSGGIVALALTGLSVIWGLLVSTRILQGRPSAKWLVSLHRWFGALSVTFTGVHIAGLVADDYVQFGWTEILVPLTSGWRPVAVSFGVVSMYLLVAVQASSMMMKRIPRTWWKRIHLSSYLLFWSGLVHGVMAGSDAANPLYVAMTALVTLATIYLASFRVLASRSRRVVRTPTADPAVAVR